MPQPKCAHATAPLLVRYTACTLAAAPDQRSLMCRCIELLPEESTVTQIVPEVAFYTALLDLYGAQTKEDVKSVENTLLEATSALRELLGQDNGLCTAAVKAHSKLLFHSIDDSRDELSKALFAQLLLLHRCAAGSPVSA